MFYNDAMKLDARTVLTALFVLLALIGVFMVLVITEKLLAIWYYLQQSPWWVWWLYGGAVMLTALALTWLYLKLTRRKSKRPVAATEIIDESSLRTALSEQSARGVDTRAAESELKELDRRRSQDQFHIALVGLSSTGKSSLVQALLPAQKISTEVLHGTTRTIHRHSYGDLLLVDVPGFDLADAAAEEMAELTRDEARRADVVVFVTTGDLRRAETDLYRLLQQQNKPLLIALNKQDQYSADEIAQIRAAIQAKTGETTPVVPIQTGGAETVITQHADGRETRDVVARPPETAALVRAIERVVGHDPDSLRRYRDASVLMLAQEKLDAARKQHNYAAAQDVIQSHTHKAIVGAMASIAPGSDLVIQGAIGTQFVKAICAIYNIQPSQIEVDRVLKLTGGKLKTVTSLVLAVAGNALKAFPGLGTAAGGLMHAVSYGMIFNSLGKAVLESVSTRGELDSAFTQQQFEENLLGHPKDLAKDLAKIALQVRRQKSTH